MPKPWPPGPWDTEPATGETYTDPLTGYECETWRHPSLGHWCGYVIVPNAELLAPFRNKEYDDLEIPGAHGGITYHEGCKVGFDCSHADDMVPGFQRDAYSDFGETYKTLTFVKDCLAQMCAAIYAEQQIEAALAGV